MFNKKSKLSHIPGKKSIYPWGDAIAFFKDYHKFKSEKLKTYGKIFKTSFMRRNMVWLMDKEATQFLLVKNAKVFSSEKSWGLVLEDLFPNGLMLMDGDRHKYHRSIIAEAFKKEPMEGYLELMKKEVDHFLQNFTEPSPKLFPTLKALTLEIALKVFFGLEKDGKFAKINKAISDIVEASSALPIKLPFTKYSKGIKARKYLVKYFNSILADKRANPQKDLFSILITAKNEDGQSLTDEQVIDHLIFILMAAHDTTASTQTSFCYFLAKYPEWQEKLRQEAVEFYQEHGDDFTARDLRKLELTGLALKETLRKFPPLVTLGRVSEKDLNFQGTSLPSDTHISIDIDHNHHNPEVWSCPHQFDPERFNKTRSEHTKCPFTYSPFGAGVHYCIGFAFAEMQIKLVMSKLLVARKWSVPADYEIPMKPVPLQEPEDGLPVQMFPITEK